MNEPARRTFLRMLGAGAGLIGLGMAGCATPEILPKSGRRVVVVGGGFGGAIAAKYLRLFDPALEVVLVERNRKYVASPFSNRVITGLRDLEGLTLGYDALAERYGVRLVFDEVTAIDEVVRGYVIEFLEELRRGGRYVAAGSGSTAKQGLRLALAG